MLLQKPWLACPVTPFAAPQQASFNPGLTPLSPLNAPFPLQELAWASYALLLNTNICGLTVYWDGQAVLARGLLGSAALGSSAAAGSGKDAAAAAALAALSGAEPAAASQGWRQGAIYCSDRAAIGKAGAGGWPSVPAGAESLLVQPLLAFGSGSEGGTAARGALLLLSERPRALSAKERAWAAAVAAKLHDALAA